jgi:hypothetical protein
LLVDEGAAPGLVKKLEDGENEDEFLISRILFLFTYGTDADFESLVDKHGLARIIGERLKRHARRYTKYASQRNPMDDMALNETAKLLFNATHFHADIAPSLQESIPHLIEIINESKIRTPPLDTPLSSVINTLINLDLTTSTAQATLFPAGDETACTEKLVAILTATLSHYKGSELEQLATPLVTLLRMIYPAAHESAKKSMESRLLPSEEERDKPLGKSETLASKLLQLSTTATTPAVRTSISALLFELSDSNADTFVQNVGYGFAAGFLASNNLPMPASAQSTQAGLGVAINPVTGQRLDRESEPEGPPMTDDEKEREAERLFVLFERLKKTEIVDVVNPVEQAMREGRFEELPDDYHDDDDDDEKENGPEGKGKKKAT